MKKSILAAALAGVILLSGCSGVSEESYNSVVAENENLKKENSELQKQVEGLKSDIETLGSNCQIIIKDFQDEIEELKAQLEQNTGGSSVGSAEKEAFLNKIADLLSSYKISKEISKLDDEDYYYARYFCSNPNRDDNYDEVYIMFYTEDINTICDKITKEVQQLNEFHDQYGDWYTIYINDNKNNHIVTIGNWDISFSGNKLFLELCWANAEMQNKYKQVESNEVFKDFTIKVIN